MKHSVLLIFLVIALSRPATALAQGTVVFDQQSSTDESPPAYGQGGAMQSILPPWGQSFTPGLGSIGFVRLKLLDGNLNDGLGATVYLNLRSGSIAGPIVGVSAPVSMPAFFRGVAEFDFPQAIPVSPGLTYFYEPVVASGGTWNIVGGTLFPYSGGTAYESGVPVAFDDWFREGILVPEPSTGALGLLGLAMLLRTRTQRS